jgi:hypothetical protein
MSRLRTRKSLALVAAALLVFAAFAPGVASLPLVVFTPLGLVISTVGVTLIRRIAVRCDEQPIALCSILASRAPPAHLVFA